MEHLKMLIDKLKKEQALTKEEWVELIEGRNAELAEYLFALAREERHHYYDHDVYVRGLIELPIIAKTTAFTAVYERVILTQNGTV